MTIGRRTPLKRTKPLARKPFKSGRGFGQRTTNFALKRKHPKSRTVLVKKHFERVAEMGCLVCGRPATLHHPTALADRIGRVSRKDHLVVPLCNATPGPHHQKVFDNESNPTSVEGLNHRGFFEKYGIDLMTEAERLWEQTLEDLG